MGNLISGATQDCGSASSRRWADEKQCILFVDFYVVLCAYTLSLPCLPLTIFYLVHPTNGKVNEAVIESTLLNGLDQPRLWFYQP